MIPRFRLYDAPVLPLSGKYDIAIACKRMLMRTYLGRYLTKLCDQVTAFISSEHAEAMVWGGDNEIDLNADTGESDRLFAFEVAKTNEQEENVSIRPGFQVFLPDSTSPITVDVCVYR